MIRAARVLDLRWAQRARPVLAAWVLCATTVLSPAWAGFVTTNQTGLNGIFSQTAFDGSPITVLFNPTVTIGRPDLLTIDTEQQLNTLFDIGNNTGPILDIFFVNDITECGGDLSPLIIGCGEQPGNKVVVESRFAAGTFGAVLMGHELGHNLGLGHIDFSANLMNSTLTGSTRLTAGQASIILQSPDVQIDSAGHHFIQITPFAVVPEPPAMLLALAGCVWVLKRVNRRRPQPRING